MKQKIISFLVGIAISSALLWGDDTLSTAAYYVQWSTVAIGLLACLLGGIKGETKKDMAYLWQLNAVGSAFALYAIVSAGYPGLAATYFVTTALIMILVFRKDESEEQRCIPRLEGVK